MKINMALSVLVFFALSVVTQAVNPPPDGGYPGNNTAEGQNALLNLTTGVYNTAVGFLSLRNDTSGNFNTGVGAGTLLFTTGDSNTATGAGALLSNTSAIDNTANGAFSLFSNTATGNTAIGASALMLNTTGGTLEVSVGGAHLGPNTAVGSHALESNVDSSSNTAVGYNALHSQVTGITGDTHLAANTAVGFEALANVNGPSNSLNDAYGYRALFDLTDGHGNVAVGALAGSGLTTGNDNIYLGSLVEPPTGVTSESDVIRIGRASATATYIAGISNQTASGGVQVFITNDGHLGTNTSSVRFKEEIKPMDKISEVILGLRPVSFRYKKEIDPQRIPQFGLVAEEVEKVNPDLVTRDKEGKVSSVRYEQINAMLLNEFLKEHRKVQELEKEVIALTAQLKEQGAQIQKVSARVERHNSTTKIQFVAAVADPATVEAEDKK